MTEGEVKSEEEKFEERWKKVQGKSNDRNTLMYKNSKQWYLQGCKDKEEEIEGLKEALDFATNELECSGLYFDHPTLVRLRKAKEKERAEAAGAGLVNMGKGYSVAMDHEKQLEERVKELENDCELFKATINAELDLRLEAESHLKDSEAKNQIYLQDIRNEQKVSKELNFQIKELKSQLASIKADESIGKLKEVK